MYSDGKGTVQTRYVIGSDKFWNYTGVCGW